MDIHKLLRHPRFRWDVRQPPSAGALDGFARKAPANLSVTSRRFLEACNGGRGPVPFAEGTVDIWPVEDVLARNEELEIAKKLPGFFAIGADGSRLFALDLREKDGAPVVSAPLFSLDAERTTPVANSFSEFLEAATLMEQIA